MTSVITTFTFTHLNNSHKPQNERERWNLIVLQESVNYEKSVCCQGEVSFAVS